MRRFNAFRHVFFIACLLLSNVILSASVIESVNGETGDRSWENANIWVGEVVPGAADTVIINGLVTVYTPVPETFTACAKLTVNSGGILRDYWAGVLHVNGDMINNGTVENSYDGTYHLFLKVSGNITNNGVWKNAVTTLNGSEVQHLSGSGEFSGNEFVSENSADTLVADTDLLFYTTTIDLNNDRLELQGNQLSLTGTGYSGGTCYLSESELIGGNGEIYANSYGVLANSVINDVTLTGIVQVANGCEFKGTVTVGDTLNNTWGDGATLDVKGNLVNNGVIRDANSFYLLTLNIDGNLTNNGEWTNYTTNLSGKNDQHLMFTSIFSGTYLNDTDSSSSIFADSDISFFTTFVELDSSILCLQGYKLSLTGTGYSGETCYLSEAELIGGNGEIYANSYGVLANSVINDVTLTGIVQVANGCEFKGTVTVGDTLNNTWGDGALLDVKGNLINNGVIRDANSFYLLTLNIDGNLTNNGEWTNTITNLSGSNAQHLAISSPFSGRFFYDTDSSSAIISDMDLYFHNCYMDLDSAEFDLQGYQLSFTGDYYTYDLKNAIITANGGSLFMNNYTYLYQTTLNGANLRGEVQINNGVIFQGTTTVEDTLQNYYYSGYTLNIQGDIINNGVIRDYYNPLTINIAGNMTNNGLWTNSRTELNGDLKQHVIINDNHAISAQLDFNAVLSAEMYQWLLDDIEITDAISQILTFNSVDESEFGHYMCKVTSSGKATDYSRTIRISNGSPEFTALPNTVFAEDELLILPLSFLFDYVEDPNDVDSILTWTIVDNDDVFTEIIADTIKFSSTLNWFGSDTLSVIVSDGVLADTANLIITVTPVNDAPVFTAIPDTSIFEDDTLYLELTTVDIDNDVLMYNVRSDTVAVGAFINGNILTLIPAEDWYGEAMIWVDVTDGELSDTVEFRFSIQALNDSPASFSLTAPADSLVNSSDTVMVFQWENSIDLDHDLLSYGISLIGENFEYVTICDTNFINLNVLDIAVPRDICIRWNVFVTDNIDTTWSNETWHFTISGQLGVKTVAELPFSFTLHQNYPNPFNPTTMIRFAVPKEEKVHLVIYDVMGREIMTLVDKVYTPGCYDVHWSGKMNSGEAVSTGIYFAVFRAGDYSNVIKMSFIK